MTKSRRYRGEPKLFIGSLPESFAEESLLPKDAKVQASLVWDGSAVLFLTVDLGSTAAREELEERLTLEGWLPYRERGRFGFQPYPGDRPFAFCMGEDRGFAASVDEVAEEESSLTIFVGRDRSHSGCVEHDPYESDVPFPILYAPQGSDLGSSSGSSGVEYQRQNAEITTKLSPWQLL
ncbi:MAG: hypothetical protein ACE5GX_20400, partial [Thermoanaerobaculia bacterium]